MKFINGELLARNGFWFLDFLRRPLQFFVGCLTTKASAKQGGFGFEKTAGVTKLALAPHA